MPSDQPNIIFIITDQQRYDTIGALGYDHVDTPNLDRLVGEGLHFTDCHVTAASCAPARASLFKGLYPHTSGILKNADTWRHSWIELLNKAGYHCTNVGKMHTWPYHASIGFDERYVVENKDRYLEGRYYFDEWDKALRFRGLIKQQRELYRKLPDYSERLGAFDWELPEDTHPDTFVGDMALWWIETFPKTEPLFLEIGFPGPHPPYDPVPRYAEPYLEKKLPLLEVTQEELDALLEPWLGNAGDAETVPVPALIDVRLGGRATPEAIDRLRDRLADVAPDARIDAQSSWLQPVFSALRSLQYLALALVLLLAVTSAAAVFLAARSALGNNRETIAIVHLLGGTDGQIAQLFQRAVLFDSMLGGAVGLVLGLAAILGLGYQFAALDSGMIASAGLDWLDWILIALIPILGVVLAVATARFTVLAAVRKML